MLEVRDLCKNFGGHRVTNQVSLGFDAGSLSAIIGPNGAGKTTLFNLMAGALRPDRGEVLLEGRPIHGLAQRQIVRMGLARAFQVASLFDSMTPLEALAAAGDPDALGPRGLMRCFPTQHGIKQAERLLALMDLEPVANRPVSELSHGDQKLLDIGLALALDPKVLLLDEPTAGMGPDERWKMIRMVQRLWTSRHLTVVIIEHDMDIVFSVAQHVIVLSQGTLLMQGDPATVRSDRRVIDAYLGSAGAEEAAA